jgi:hypothetical protein
MTAQMLRLQEDLTEQLNQQDAALQQQLKKLKKLKMISKIKNDNKLNQNQKSQIIKNYH